MMDTMVQFSLAILEGVGSFLASEPVIYLFALVCLCAIIKVIKSLLP